MQVVLYGNRCSSLLIAAVSFVRTDVFGKMEDGHLSAI